MWWPHERQPCHLPPKHPTASPDDLRLTHSKREEDNGTRLGKAEGQRRASWPWTCQAQPRASHGSATAELEQSDLTIVFLILCALIRTNYLRICLDLTDTSEYHSAHINLFLHYGHAYIHCRKKYINWFIRSMCLCSGGKTYL